MITGSFFFPHIKISILSQPIHFIVYFEYSTTLLLHYFVSDRDDETISISFLHLAIKCNSVPSHFFFKKNKLNKKKINKEQSLRKF